MNKTRIIVVDFRKKKAILAATVENKENNVKKTTKSLNKRSRRRLRGRGSRLPSLLVTSISKKKKEVLKEGNLFTLPFGRIMF